MGASLKSLEVSRRHLENAQAVLVINGTLDGPSPDEFRAMIEAPEAVDQFGTAFGSQPGLICKHVLAKENVIGGCYLFESVDDVEAYLNSDFWRGCEKETKWKNVRGEVFEVV